MIRGFRGHKITKIVLFVIVIAFVITGLVSGGIYLAKQKTLEQELAKKSGNTAKPSSHSSGTSTPSKPRPPTYVELTDEQKAVITRVIEDSPMVDAIPAKYPISFQIFYFEEGYRVWQNKYILADGGIVSGGDPEVHLTLHARYLPEFENRAFCDVLTQANKNRDLGFESELGEMTLMWRYKGLMGYKSCLGF